MPGRLIARFQNRNVKKLFFLRQYEATQKKIWGMEFAVNGLKEGREILRREYDKLTEDVDAATIARDNNEKKEDADKDVREHLDKAIESKKREIEEWKKKVDMSDETITGVQDQIDAFHEQLPQLEKEIRRA